MCNIPALVTVSSARPAFVAHSLIAVGNLVRVVFLCAKTPHPSRNCNNNGYLSRNLYLTFLKQSTINKLFCGCIGVRGEIDDAQVVQSAREADIGKVLTQP